MSKQIRIMEREIVETDAPIGYLVTRGQRPHVGDEILIGSNPYRVVTQRSETEFEIARIRRITEVER